MISIHYPWYLTGIVTKTPHNVRLLKKAHFKTRISAHFFQGRFTWYFQNIITPFLSQNLNILPFLNKGSMN